MMQCATCGAGNPDTNIFCSNCGATLSASGPQSSGSGSSQPYGSPSGGYPPGSPGDYPPTSYGNYPPPGNYPPSYPPPGGYQPPNPYQQQPPNPYNQAPPNPYGQPPPNPYAPQVQINMGQPVYLVQPNRPQVSVGLCAVLSFFWSGAGFFLIPDRVGLAVVLVICTVIFNSFLLITNIGTAGLGLFCTFPIWLTYWLAIMIWNIIDAQNYNQGRR